MPLTVVSWGVYLGVRYGLALLGASPLDQIALAAITVATLIIAGLVTIDASDKSRG
jgi:hypothetical protein